MVDPAASTGQSGSRLGAETLLIGLYLIVRIPIVNGWSLLMGRRAGGLPPELMELAMFLLIAALIWVRRGSLAEVNHDTISIVLFALFSTILRTSTRPLSVGVWLEVGAYFAVGVLLVVGLARERCLVRPSWIMVGAWSIWGLLAGFLLKAAVQAPWILATSQSGLPEMRTAGIFGTLIVGFVHFMGHSAILEEPVFRGSLWGNLRSRGWTDRKTWLLQAALFWLAHFKLVGTPYSFWYAVPLSGLVLGWLAWKTRSLVPGLFAHSIYNALTSVLQGV